MKGYQLLQFFTACYVGKHNNKNGNVMLLFHVYTKKNWQTNNSWLILSILNWCNLFTLNVRTDPLLMQQDSNIQSSNYTKCNCNRPRLPFQFNAHHTAQNFTNGIEKHKVKTVSINSVKEKYMYWYSVYQVNWKYVHYFSKGVTLLTIETHLQLGLSRLSRFQRHTLNSYMKTNGLTQQLHEAKLHLQSFILSSDRDKINIPSNLTNNTLHHTP